MRAYLASSIGVACTAALALPLALHPGPAHARAERAERTATSGSTQSLPLLPLAAGGLDRSVAAPGGDAGDRGVTAPSVRPFSLVGVVWDQSAADLRARVQVRTRAVGGDEWSPWRELLPYGDEAPDPDSPEHRGARARGGTAPLWVGASDGVQARIRPERTTGEPATDEGATDEGARAAGEGARGPSAGEEARGSGEEARGPGEEARVPGEEARAATAGEGGRPTALPAGLRLELVDPGEAPPPPPDRAALRALPAHPAPTPGGTGPGAKPSAGGPGKPAAERPGKPSLGRPVSPSPSSGWPGKPSPKPSSKPSSKQPPSKLSPKPSSKPSSVKPSPKPSSKPSVQPTEPTESTESTQPPGALPAEVETKANAARHTAPRPRIITRAGWGADEKIREKGHVYSKTVKVAFIHHTVTGNTYSCSQAPSVLRSIYRYHVKSLGWRDYGYNFTVDKCGKIYEGRSGGVTKAVRGAHTLGFNTNSMGVAVLGTFSTKEPSAKAVKAIAKLTAWKLGLFKRNPRGTTHLVSGGGNKYKKGAKVKLHVIAGHRDGFATECPGKRLYKKLGSVRKTAARLQGR
ncbi:N-acetylmuramoyl-L-alanine amidase [Streptomyces sp. S465]|uniref:N-acetylmuramoyl-L-alanine amidase n=1 Tax=Streptomyces sp. S465 TaxID=2979468 RepID=UPI0022A8A235|nr:N-acetylmuramoyl-L-alanine amidase [Streptomyces sp. S465]WAP56440.1 N-acetylmuramoyl-L-alanine amidase [Streptomyces sp. S465]